MSSTAVCPPDEAKTIDAGRRDITVNKLPHDDMNCYYNARK